MLIHTLRLTDNVIRKRAPPRTVFRIDAVSFANKTGLAAAFVYLVDRWFPFTTSDTIPVGVSNVLAAMDITIAGQNHLVTDIGERAKYITLGKTDAAASDCLVSIYGEIVRATELELIVEYLRRFS